ncbi:QueT transporter family protein [Pediococcus pentosaceus]|uniref:QueT transporter family protein n=1 Tax=Pediococcus pentosaceus TaxID=1255 RepID=UPI00223C055B|nr:QueT transporter family protein [Pediococcus pentosaceus]MCT1175499.1 QueT transporter family protein [Pediococcus pentosaceus]
MSSSKINTREIVLSAMIAALYVAITFVFSAISFGPIQFRLAEMLNCLVIYDKRYIWGISLGVLISNMQSSLGIIDITWGTLTTIITLSIVYLVIRKFSDTKVKMGICVAITTVLMGFLVAIELAYVLKVPFFYTWGTVSLGELGVMLIGAVVIYLLGENVNLSLSARR